MPKSATGAPAPSPKTSSESGCHPKGTVPPSCPEAFFAAAIGHLVGAGRLSLGHVLKGLPLETAVDIFAATVSAEGKPTSEAGSVDPRLLFYTTPLSGAFGMSARRYSYAGILDFLRAHVYDAPGNAARLLKAFPIEGWIGAISLEYLWSLVSQASCWGGEEASAQELETVTSGTRTADVGRAHAVVLLSAAIATGFVSTDNLETHGQGLDPLAQATVLIDDMGPKQALADILAPAAETFGIMNARSAWAPEADTKPQDPPSLARVRAAGG